MTQTGGAAQNAEVWQRALRWGFGILWILDGLLKLQPKMFTSALVINVLGPNALNDQPKWLYSLMFQGANLWHAGLPVTTLLLAIVELLLGIGLLFARGRWFRLTLWGILAWCAVVWVMAEGMGGILTGSATFAEDSPGSTPFYALGALLLLYPSIVRPTLHRWAGAFWAAAAVVQCLPYNWSASQIAGIFGDVSMNGGEPAFIDRLNNNFLMMGYHAPVVMNLIMVAVMAVLAWGYWNRRIKGPIWWLTIAWLAFLWMVPQAFATLFTGTATDLGDAFPLILLLWTTKYMARFDESPSRAKIPNRSAIQPDSPA